MKKYLLTSVISLTLCIALIVHLYKTKDIEWIDAIVETSTAALGIRPKMVTDKVERKIKQQQEQFKLVVPMTDETSLDTAQQVVEINDSVTLPLPVEDKKMKKLVQQVDTSSLKIDPFVVAAPKPDSITVIATAAPSPPKRKLFNATIDPTSNTTAAKGMNAVTEKVYFNAEINTAQRFEDDQEIIFRTSEAVKIGEELIPEKFVFRAKANVFDGRIHFIVKSIHDMNVKGENFKDQLPGMPIRADFQLEGSYFLSDGYPVVFGITL